MGHALRESFTALYVLSSGFRRLKGFFDVKNVTVLLKLNFFYSVECTFLCTIILIVVVVVSRIFTGILVPDPAKRLDFLTKKNEQKPLYLFFLSIHSSHISTLSSLSFESVF